LRKSATLLFQSDTPSQRDLLVFHFWFRVPLSEVLGMHPAVKPDARGILTNQSKPTGQAGAFGAAKFEPLSNLLDSESVYHISMVHKDACAQYSTSAQAE
jgi:hypothetical protein